MNVIQPLTALCLFGCLLPVSAAVPVPEAVDPAFMSWLDNGKVRVGVNLKLGGAITFLSRDGGGNLINNYDRGRQAQLSFYSGPVPYTSGDKKPAPHWEHLGWNPIQAGDDFGHGPEILLHENDGKTLHVRCTPLQWPLDQVAAECTFDTWLELDGIAVKGRARLTNHRADKTLYAARQQELPAVYVNAPYHRVLSYQGDAPFTNGPATPAPPPPPKFPWSAWLGTEGWSAVLDDQDHGLGLLTPGRVQFAGGFAGKPGPNDTTSVHTGYVAGQAVELLDHNIVYEYRYELVPGSLAEIRARAAKVCKAGLPTWTFDKDRQCWTSIHATDTGWPLQGALHLKLEADDPQLLSPLTFWRAEDAPVVTIELAMHSPRPQAVLFWQHLGEGQPRAKSFVSFPVQADGEFHRYTVRLSDQADYTGAMNRLRLDPVPSGTAGDWVKVKSVTLAKE